MFLGGEGKTRECAVRFFLMLEKDKLGLTASFLLLLLLLLSMHRHCRDFRGIYLRV